MHNQNYVILEGRIKSEIASLPDTQSPQWMEFTLRTRHDFLGPDGKGKRLYYHIPIIIESPEMMHGIATYGHPETNCTVTGRLVRRKRSRPDSSTYMTTCVLATNIQIVANLEDAVPSDSLPLDEGDGEVEV